MSLRGAAVVSKQALHTVQQVVSIVPPALRLAGTSDSKWAMGARMPRPAAAGEAAGAGPSASCCCWTDSASCSGGAPCWNASSSSSSSSSASLSVPGASPPAAPADWYRSSPSFATNSRRLSWYTDVSLRTLWREVMSERKLRARCCVHTSSACRLQGLQAAQQLPVAPGRWP